jgi:hypothetical protein
MIYSARSNFVAILISGIVIFFAAQCYTDQPAVKHRQFNGTASVIIGLAGNAKLSEPYDSVKKPTIFHYIATTLPHAETVTSDFVFNATTQKGKSIALRLVRPGNGVVDLVAGKIDEDLVFELTFDGKKFQLPVHWTTTQISDDFGTERGSFAVIDPSTEKAQVKLVGTSRFTPPPAGKEAPPTFVIRIIAEGQLSTTD